LNGRCQRCDRGCRDQWINRHFASNPTDIAIDINVAADLCRAAALVQDPISLTSGFAEARRQHPRTLFLDTDPLLVQLE
jgi:hypothetical protein